jgi:tetratricopeptide (TPR) repeat protein
MRASFTSGRAVAWAFLFVVLPPLSVGVAADDANPSAPKPASKPAQVQAKLPTEQQCRDWGALFEKSVSEGYLKSGNDLIDWDKLLETATAYPNPSPGLVKFRAGFINGAKPASIAPSGFLGQIISLVQRGGEYKFLHCLTVDGHRCAEFRWLTPAGGLNYHIFALASFPDGSVRAVDYYVFLTGEWQSAALRQTFLPFTQTWMSGGNDQLTPAERDFVGSFAKVSAMAEWLGQKEYRKVLETYQRLPESVKKNKSVLVMRLTAAREVGPEEQLRLVDDYRKYYPNDASIDLISFDALLMRKQHDQALASLDRIDKAVGGDPYVRVMRASVLQKQGKLDAAWKAAEDAIAEEPTLLTAFFCQVSLSMEKRDFAKTAELLSTIEAKFHFRFQNLANVPVYAEFVKSKEYKTWMKSHGGRP